MFIRNFLGPPSPYLLLFLMDIPSLSTCQMQLTSAGMQMRHQRRKGCSRETVSEIFIYSVGSVFQDLPMVLKLL